MSVALCIPPYEFDDDLGPDDLSDVDLNHPNFLAAFPDGVVPITHVPSPRLGMGDGFFTWAENVLAVHDAVTGLDVDTIMCAVDMIQNHVLAGGDQDIASTTASRLERKRLFLPLLRARLSLRVIGRLLHWTDRAIAEALFSPDLANAGALVRADELVMEEGWSCRAAARECGIGYQAVRRLQVMRLAVADTTRVED